VYNGSVQNEQITKNFQNSVDKIIDKLFLRYIPKTVRPNHVTLIRFMLIPFVYFLIMSESYYLALIVFVVAACTDFIDGAMARTRNQITDTGKVIDPIADKLLILSVLVFFAGSYLVVKIFIVFIIFELIAVMLGVVFSYTVGRPMGANVFGKLKMILQSFGVGFFILGLLIENTQLISFAEDVLYTALVFAILAGMAQFRNKLIRLDHRH